eukprot:gene15026-18356_t
MFTYQRGDAQFKRGVSILATLVMGCAGASCIYILKGELRVPAQGWPLAVLVVVFAIAVIRSGGNLAGVLRPEPNPVWTGPDRRRTPGGSQIDDPKRGFRFRCSAPGISE